MAQEPGRASGEARGRLGAVSGMKRPTPLTRSAMSRELLKLERPTTWPAPLQTYLETQHDLFLGREIDADRVPAALYDKAIGGLMDALQPYAIRGWHCTRLTDYEIDEIQTNGMLLPNAAMLTRRINALVKAGQLASAIAQQLIAKNQADDPNRADKLWFYFYPPRRAGEKGVGRFFRHWGGEGLYNLHEDDPVTSPAIRCIGTSCVIEADVPIALLKSSDGLALKVVRRFLKSRGYRMREPVDHADRINRPLPTNCIRRVIRFLDSEFASLTGCDAWRSPLGQ
jgi:hypothetical protein